MWEAVGRDFASAGVTSVLDLWDMPGSGTSPGDAVGQDPGWIASGFKRLGFLRGFLSETTGPVHYVHLTQGLRDVDSGAQTLGGAVMSGVASMLGAEMSRVTARTVDIDADADVVAVAQAELGSQDEISVAAWRDGERLSPQMVPLATQTGSFNVPADGAIVISGGLGGLGREIAVWLAAKGTKSLVLMGHRSLPERSTWASSSDDRVAAVLALEAAGVSVITYSGALDDVEPLTAFLHDVREQFGAIRGLIHCAGKVSAGEASFVRKTAADWTSVLTPKVNGLTTLMTALEDDALAFSVLFSSVSAVVPRLAVGLSDYAAANGFMDHLAAYWQARGRNVRSVQWPNWIEAGLGETQSPHYSALGFRGLTTARGLGFLEQVLSLPAEAPAAILPGLIARDAPLTAWLSTAPVVPAAPAAPTVPAPALNDGNLLAWLRDIFMSELKLTPEELATDVHFDELGVDSILLADLTRRLDSALDTQLNPNILLEHPNLAALAAYLSGEGLRPATLPEAAAGMAPPAALAARPVAATFEPSMSRPPSPSVSTPEGRVAVIGLSCRFPGAADAEGFWSNLRNGVDGITEVPAERWDIEALYDPTPTPGKSISKWGGFLDDVAGFDAGAFGITDEDAPYLDPLIRLMLEGAVQCLRAAGYDRAAVKGTRTGLYVGARIGDYGARARGQRRKGTLTGSAQNFVSAHVSHVLDLHGPSIVIDTACSSSLVSTHLACRAVLAGECDTALAGGVDLLLDEKPYLGLSAGHALSPDGRCHTFDEGANGFVPGEGCGLVLLKRLDRALADGDQVLAVIEGSAINNDGRTMGLTTPNPAMQEAVVRAALSNAGVRPVDVGYVETHGTGTMIGDPIELKSLRQAFGDVTETGFCGIGSVKTNIGHLLSAAGVASLIKVVLMLQHGQQVPTLHCQRPNPRFDFANSPFAPMREAAPWPARNDARRAAVSSFGFGGTNACMVLSDATPQAYQAQRTPLPPEVFNRKRHWLDPVAGETSPVPSQPVVADLALTAEASADPATLIWKTVIHHDNPIVRDHRVHGVRILPGVTFLDVILRSLQAEGQDPWSWELRNVIFHQPAATAPERDVAVRVTLHLVGDGPARRVTVSGQAPGESWRDLVEADLRPALDGDDDAAMDPAEITDNAERTVNLDAIYARARSVEIEHRAFMKSEGLVHVRGDEAVATLGLSAEGRQQSEAFLLHPALLDASTLVPFVFANEGTDVKPYIPFSIECFRARGPLPSDVLVRTSRPWTGDGHRSDGGDTGAMDVYYSNIALLDSDGRVLARIDRLAAKRIREAGLIQRLTATQAAPAPLSAAPSSAAVFSTAAQAPTVERYLQHLVAAALGGTWDAVAVDVGFYELGLDSRNLLDLVRQLEADLSIDLYPTLLFEHGTVTALATYLQDNHGQALANRKAAVDAPSQAPPPPEAPAADQAQALFLTPRWENGPGRADPAERLLVIGSDEDDKTPEDTPWPASHVLFATPGKAFKVIDQDHVRVNLTTEAGGQALIQHLRAHDSLPDRVVFKGAFEDARRFTAAWLAAAGRAVLNAVFIHDGAPKGAGFQGYARSIAQESPWLRWRSAQADTMTDIRAEAGIGFADGLASRWLDGLRQHEKLAPVAPAEQNGATPPTALRREGVYLITGGTGGIGAALAKHLTQRWAARVMLCGRRPKDVRIKALLAELNSTTDVQAAYVWADVSTLEGARAAVKAATTQFGPLNGVIHAAGVLADGFEGQVSEADIARVLAPKIDGARQLDAATQDQTLDVFMLFGSTTGWLGNAGQGSYGYANGVLDAFAGWRDGFRDGRTLCLGWPLWAEVAAQGGMGLSDDERARLRSRFGVEALTTATGLDLFEQALTLDAPRLILLHGDRDRLLQGLAGLLVSSTPIPVAATVKAAAIDADEPIAIIGLAGRYPGAGDDPEGFWDVLSQGRDCISDVPPERWNHDPYYDASGETPGKTYGKWGGFLDNMDHFDPLLFRISPREARVMDPQERLFLETAWTAFEDAGYARQRLQGQRVGVYVGVMWQEYQLYGIEAARRASPLLPMSFSSSVANRVSYVLDLHGPSLTLDTACSSSLTAIHLACESLHRGESTMALAGGVNLSLHPSKYQFLAQGRMLSTDGRCRGFGANGDGYVPGEGVGAIVLKPLSLAQADGDVVQGIILATGVNHGGRTSGYTVPSPAAQAEIVTDVLGRGGVVNEISYIEAHGTGTALGDPIEIEGLCRAFKNLGADTDRRCAIGTVKSNIGHLESAAGIAGVTKVLLQLRHRQLVPSLHTQDLNPRIDFENTPFRVQRSLEDWTLPAGVSRRVAGVSAFGAGGTNAHVIIAEAPSADRQDETEPSPQLDIAVLSARTEEQLKVYAQRMADWLRQQRLEDTGAEDLEPAIRDALAQQLGLNAQNIDLNETWTELGIDAAAAAALQRTLSAGLGLTVSHDDLRQHTTPNALIQAQQNATQPHNKPRLADIAWTLRQGRDPMAARAAIVTDNTDDLLNAFDALAKGQHHPDLQSGRRDNKNVPIDLDDQLNNNTLKTIAANWTKGQNIDWQKLKTNQNPKTIRIPTYPFEKKRYWVDVDWEGSAPRAPSIPKTPPQVFAHAEDFGLVRKAWRRSSEPSAEDVPIGIVMLVNRESARAVRNVFPGSLLIEDDRYLDDQGPNHWTADFTLPQVGEELAARILEHVHGPVTLIDLCDGGGQEGGIETLPLGRLALLRKLIKDRRQGFRILHVTGTSWHGAAMAGLVRVLGVEHQDVRARTVSTDRHDTDSLQILLATELTPEDNNSEIRWRDGVRFEPYLQTDPLPMTEGVETALADSIDPNRPVVVSGGTQGIGLSLAHYLVDRGLRRLVLIGRTALPPQSDWPRYLDDVKTRPELKAKLSGLQALIDRGVMLKVFAGSVSDEAGIADLLAMVRTEMGTPQGVIHSAGVVDEETPWFLDKAVSSIERVINPKMVGIQVLDRLTADDDLTFFVACSSVAFLPAMAVGLSDYSAANAFIDTYVENQRENGRHQFHAVQWVGWSDTGMHKKHSPQAVEMVRKTMQDNGVALCDSPEGCRMFAAMIAADVGVALPSRVNMAALQPRLEGLIRPQKASVAPLPRTAKKTGPVDVDLLSDDEIDALLSMLEQFEQASPDTKPSAPETLMEAPEKVRSVPLIIVDTISRIMGLEPEDMDADTPFNEIGLDSISAAKVTQSLEKELSVVIIPKWLFDYPTGNELASCIATAAAE